MSSITYIEISPPQVYIKSIYLSYSASAVKDFNESIHFVDILS